MRVLEESGFVETPDAIYFDIPAGSWCILCIMPVEQMRSIMNECNITKTSELWDYQYETLKKTALRGFREGRICKTSGRILVTLSMFKSLL